MKIDTNILQERRFFGIKTLQRLSVGLCSVALLLLVLIGNIQAQKEILKFDNYSKDDGLLHSFILSICQDKEGFIWIGSYNGLNRYDGVNVASFTNKQNAGLVSETIYKIFEQKNDSGNVLWLGTEAGLIKFEKKVNKFQYFEGLKNPITSIAEDSKGYLWLGTKQMGLYKFNPQTAEFIATTLSYPKGSSKDLRINALVYEQPDILWIACYNDGLIKYNCTSGIYKQLNVGNSSSGSKLTSIYNRGNDLFIGTWGEGLIQFNKKSEQFANVNSLLVDNQSIHKIVTDILGDNNGNLWIATYGGGLYKLSVVNTSNASSNTFQVKKYEVINNGANSICSNFLRTLCKDYTGNIWIGSSGGGLSKIDFFKHKFKHYFIELPGNSQQADNNISAICEDKKGNVWYGTRNNGVFVYNSDGRFLTHIDLNNIKLSDSRNAVREIYNDKYNRIWVGTDDGLFLFSSVSASFRYFKPNSSIDNGILAICLDKDDALWVSVGYQGVCKLSASEISKADSRNAHFEEFKHNDNDSLSIASSQTWGIYKDSGDNLWFATSAGLDCYNYSEKRFKHVLRNNFSCILEPSAEKGDYLWLGTYGKGVFLMNKNDFSSVVFNVDNGLCHNNINGILEDERGFVWVSTGKGVAKINVEGLYGTNLKNLTTENDIIANRIKNFSRNEGLQSHEFNLNASERFRSGKLAFGGPRGINIFNPLNMIENSYVFPVIISDFKIYNKSIKGDSSFNSSVVEYLKEIELNYKQNYFTVDFAEICLTSPEKAVYSYILEGFDTDWITTDAKHNSATYTELSDGVYEFKVKASNADGVWNNQVTKLKITIHPPFWRTMFFRVFLILSLLAFLYWLFQQLIKRQDDKKRKALEQQKEQFEKDKLKSDLDYKNRELASTTLHLVKKNEKLIEIKNMLLEAKELAQSKDKTRIHEIINTIEQELKNQDNWENFEISFNLIHNNFIKRLTDAYPALSSTDIKICAYMRMNLSSKEIANLLNIASASLETSRIRIRKKMNLETAVFLSNFILRF